MAKSKKTGLGRGIEALFEENNLEETQSGENVVEIDLQNIRPNPYQPRRIFDQKALKELAKSIQESGVFQPIILRQPNPQIERYEIIAGERRFRASKLAKQKTIPAIIRDFNDERMMEVAVLENLQREDLTPLEEAQAYQRLLDLNNLTQAQLAEELGKSQSFIANKLRLLKLSRPVQQAILNRKISERHGRALVRLDSEQQAKVLKDVLNNHLSVKETEKKVNRIVVPRMKPKNRSQIKGVAKDVRLAVNTIKQSVKMVRETGIDVQVEEETTDDVQKIVIEIPLKNKNERK